MRDILILQKIVLHRGEEEEDEVEEKSGRSDRIPFSSKVGFAVRFLL